MQRFNPNVTGMLPGPVLDPLQTTAVEAFGVRLDHGPVAQSGEPGGGDPTRPIESPGELAVDSPGRIRVIAEVYGQKTALLERIAIVESPECRFERTHHVARAPYLRWLPALERACRNLVYLRGERMLFPETGYGTVAFGE